MTHDSDTRGNGERHYHRDLRLLQIELVKFQRHLIEHGDRILLLLEGRDAAGKDGVIKHVVEHLSPRDTRIVALRAPTDQERGAWYFQRYAAHLPTAGEFVLFNRSWYNRAGVERVMGFCGKAETETFLDDAPVFERLLTGSGIRLFKYYLDIDRDEQKRRLKDRRDDPLTQWKISPIDEAALKHWDDYTRARNEMLRRTHTAYAPWWVVRANDKRAARLNLIRHLLSHMRYHGQDHDLLAVDEKIVFGFDEDRLSDGSMAG